MTSTDAQPVEVSTFSVKGTVMKPATQKETDEVINQMLDMDLHPEDNEKDGYDVPLAPNQIQVQPSEMVQKTNNNEQTTAPDAEGTDTKPLLLPRVLGTAIKIETPANNEKPIPRRKVFKLWNINSKGNIQNQGNSLV